MVAIIPPASIFNKIYLPEVQNKQQQFEDYVINTLFPTAHFSSLSLNNEWSKKSTILQQHALNPHFYLKDKATGKKFMVECKYRGGCIASSLQLAQALHFTHTHKKEDSPYFFILGIGGTPADPAQVFLVNLQSCAYLVLYKRHLKGKEIKQHQSIPSASLWH